MEITTETNEQDHIAFYKQYGLKRSWQQRFLILLAVDVVASGFELLSSIYFINLLIIGVLLLPVLFVIPYFVAKKNFKDAYDNLLYPDLRKTYKPFASGIEITDETQTVFLRYEDIMEAGRVGTFIFLLLNDGRYYLLPTWCFANENEAGRFLTIVTNGIANAKGIEPKAPLTFKPIYLIGLLCLIPLVGAITGVVLIILGVAHFKDKVFVIMGSIGVLITVILYGSLFYQMHNMENSHTETDALAHAAQTQLNDLVKNIEFYKLQNGLYPDSLQQLDTKESPVSIYDMTQAFKGDTKSVTYQYQKKGNKYLLFSVGEDGKPNTKDDIYPTITAADTSKLGFIRR